MADGSITYPMCAFLSPADEPSEGTTVSLVGYFGTREQGGGPLKLEVTGDVMLIAGDGTLINAKGASITPNDGVRPYGSNNKSKWGPIGDGIYG